METSHAFFVSTLTVSRGGRRVLSDVSFTLNNGEALALTGVNGAGKSTLLRALAGLLPIDSGTLNGVKPSDAHYIGHLDAVKPSLTLEENLTFFVEFEGGDKSRIKQALTAFNLHHLRSFPASILSQGQRRRLALARLLALPKPLWLLDEPYAGLDAAHEKLLTLVIEQHLGEGGLAIIATHHVLAFPHFKKELAHASVD